MRLAGKVAVVTGGTSGIGRRIVERFREEGAAVVFSARRIVLGEDVARRTGATFVVADVTSEDDAARTLGTAIDRHGRVDILVNNAGSPAQRGRIETLSLASFDEAMAVHVRGALAHIKHASPLMRARHAGSIVNIASITGHRVGYASSLLYSVAKAALLHLTRCAAMELGEDNVRVNSISPGIIATGIFGKAKGLDADVADAAVDRIRDAIAKAQAIPHAGSPDDVASAAVFLASDDARFINGEDLVVDGGLIWGRRYSETAAAAMAMDALLE